MTARTGDVIHTVEQLEAMPDRSVILDRHGDAWQQSGTLQEGDTTQAAWLGFVPVSCRQSSAVDLPATVLHVPGEQEPVGDDVIERAAAGCLRQEPPTRDEIARAMEEKHRVEPLGDADHHHGCVCGGWDNSWDCGETWDEHYADAVLALLEGRKR